MLFELLGSDLGDDKGTEFGDGIPNTLIEGNSVNFSWGNGMNQGTHVLDGLVVGVRQVNRGRDRIPKCKGSEDLLENEGDQY